VGVIFLLISLRALFRNDIELEKRVKK